MYEVKPDVVGFEVRVKETHEFILRCNCNYNAQLICKILNYDTEKQKPFFGNEFNQNLNQKQITFLS